MSKIVIYGLGKTGDALRKLLEGNDLWLYDDDPSKSRLAMLDVPWDAVDYVVVSPGVSPNSAFWDLCRKKGVPVVGETQLCFDRCKGDVVSVTGTNGKTTVTTMIHKILTENGVSSYLLGNGGVPFAEKVSTVRDGDVVVLESSSFQLKDCTAFRPKISVLTNIHLDHVDYHGSFAQYVESKCNNFINQTGGQFAVFNADDDNVVQLSCRAVCDKLFYSLVGDSNCSLEGNFVKIAYGDVCETFPADSIMKLTDFNKSNALCALLVCRLLGVPLKNGLESLANFTLGDHRNAYVGSVKNVRFVDDSKGTNPHATLAALRSVQGNVALILGGSDKGYSFDCLFDDLPNVRFVAAMGQTADEIFASARRSGFAEVQKFADLDSATNACYDILKECGGTVLLSPACASFDAFSGYAERGEKFVQAYRRIKNAEKDD